MYVIYPAIGFIGSLLGLERAWHFTVGRIPRDTIKPCMYKQAKLALAKAK
jgi:hypothetical protein